MKVHRIYDLVSKDFIAEVPLKSHDEDSNAGLPDWFFENEGQHAYINLEVDVAKDEVQWWPPCGPAPHWTAKWSEVKESPIKPFMVWYEATY